MLRIKAIALVVLVLGLSAAGYFFASTHPIEPGTPPKSTAPADGQGNDFDAIEITGKRFSLSALSGKPVIVHFWASWCGPCVEEFPKMVRFIESFDGQIDLVAVSADPSDEDIKAFLKKTGVKAAPFLHLVRDDGGKVATQYKARMLPTSVILAKGLTVEKRISGEVDWEDSRLRAFFVSLTER